MTETKKKITTYDVVLVEMNLDSANHLTDTEFCKRAVMTATFPTWERANSLAVKLNLHPELTATVYTMVEFK